MNINTNDFSFINFNNQKMQWVRFNNELIYENWEKINTGGVPPVTLSKCKGKLRELPNEYQELEYIESNGTQYIDTGYIPSRTLKIVDTVSNIMAISGGATLFGASGDNNNRVQVYHNVGPRFGARMFDYGQLSTLIPNNFADKITITYDCKNLLFYLSTGQNTALKDGTKSTFNYSITIFGNNVAGSIATLSTHRQHTFRIYDNDILVRDMVPCCRKSDDTVGMYDLVNNTFYENAGTGNFIKGELKDLLVPEEYQQIEYIESTGTQWIDTKYVPKANDIYKIQFSQTSIEANQIIFGSRTSGAYTDSLNQVYLNKSRATATPDGLLFFSGTTNQNLLTTEIDKCYNLKLEINNGNFDNTSDKSLYLFGFNNMGEITANSYTKLFRFKIYNSNILIRDFIPCYRKSDNVVGLYDKVNNVFYINEGTGEFLKGRNTNTKINLIDYKIYGNSKQKTLLPSEYQQVEYIETTGTEYIDSGVPLLSGLKTVVDWVYRDAVSGNNYTGGHIGSPGNRWSIGSQRKNNYYFFAIGGTNLQTEFQFGNRDIVEAYWKSSNSYIKVNGVNSTSFSWKNYVFTDEPNYTFYMGAVNRDGNGILNPRLKIYSWKFYQDDVLIRSFIPCYRKSDDVIGLYDLVENKFYTNNGTGTFLKGNDVLPSPNNPVEIQSVGDKSTNILNPDFSKTNAGTYSYILLSDTPKVLTLRLIDRDTSVDITNVSFGFTGNGANANDGFHWCVAGGGIRDRFITNNTNNSDNPIENPLMYFSVYPKSQATWEAVFKRFYIQIVEGEYTEATIPEYEPYGYKIPIKVTNSIYDFNKKNIKKHIYDADGKTRYGFDLGVLKVGNYTFGCKIKETTPNYIYLREKTIEGIFNTWYITTTANEKPRIPLTFSANGTSNFYVIFAGSAIDTETEAYEHWDKIENAWLQKDTEIKSCITNIYLKEPLRKAEDYNDYISFSDNKSNRNVASTVFNGTEGWEIHTSIDGGNVFRLDNVLNPLTNAPMSSTHMSHFNLTNIYSTAKFDINTYRLSSNQEVDKITGNRLYIATEHATLEEFKSWLAENKPSITYPTPTNTETIELPLVHVSRGTNIIEINTEIQPSNMEVTYWGKAIES